jgi:tyrosinase
MNATSMLRQGTSRRSLLKLGATIGATALLPWRSAEAATSVRPDVNSTAGAKMAGLYAQAVAKMQDPAINIPPQPGSWTFQAYIHGVPDDPFHLVEAGPLIHGTPEMSARIDLIYGKPAKGTPQAAWKAAALQCWGTCPHSSPWFVAWHRWYLFYFEKIVRKMSGAPDFALPYWNYASDQGASLQLPTAFQDSNSPLYEDLRGLGFADAAGTGDQNVPMNNGGYMPYPQIDFGPALSAVPLFPSDAQPTPPPPDPAYEALGFSGRLEVQPHDFVHVNVGGRMSNVPVAAGDPVFFVHHCQIDRLWAGWQAESGSVFNWGTTPMDPSKKDWGDGKFIFVDEANKLVTVTATGELDTKIMGYEYDLLPAAKPAIAAVAAAPAARPSPPAIVVAGAVANGISVGSQGARTTLAPTPAPAPTPSLGPPAATQGAAPPRTTLVLKDVKLISRPPAPLHVFLNLPEGTAPALNGPYDVGTLNFFNWDTRTGGPMMAMPGPGGSSHAMQGSGEFRFDVGDLLARQKADNLWDGGAITVTVATLGADKSRGRTYVSIGEVQLLP